MSTRSFEVVLSRNLDRTWTSAALSLPKAHLAAVSEVGGAPVSYRLEDERLVAVGSDASALIARIELPEELVAQSAFDRQKNDLERDKLTVEERAGRRTFWAGIYGAAIAATATITVAVLSQCTGSKPAPKAYWELVECREELNRLNSLSQSEKQTVPQLRTAISRSIDGCRGRLDAAIATSPP